MLAGIVWQFWECDRCDGCGWYEGGTALKTSCADCDGTGVVMKHSQTGQLRQMTAAERKDCEDLRSKM